jgi:hypothetical protein
MWENVRKWSRFHLQTFTDTWVPKEVYFSRFAQKEDRDNINVDLVAQPSFFLYNCMRSLFIGCLYVLFLFYIRSRTTFGQRSIQKKTFLVCFCVDKRTTIHPSFSRGLSLATSESLMETWIMFRRYHFFLIYLAKTNDCTSRLVYLRLP